MSLLGGGAGVVLGGFGLTALALGLAVWLALRRPRRAAMPARPAGVAPGRAMPEGTGGTASEAAGAGTRRIAGPGPGHAGRAEAPVAANGLIGEAAAPLSGLPPDPSVPASERVQAEIAAHLRRLADARSARPRRPLADTAATPATPATPVTAPGPIGSPDLATRRAPVVLIVDDARVVRVRLARLLAPLGWTVLEAADGQTALERLGESAPDLLITDVAMPGLDGFALVRAIRAEPTLARLPVIVVSGDDDRHREEAARSGVSVLLGKSFGEAALLAHIRRLVPGQPVMSPAVRPAPSVGATAAPDSSLVGAGR
jgi:CheY-like chemotaxis protein